MLLLASFVGPRLYGWETYVVHLLRDLVLSLSVELRLASGTINDGRPCAHFCEIKAASHQRHHDTRLYSRQLLADTVSWAPLKGPPRTGRDAVVSVVPEPALRDKGIGRLAKDGRVPLDYIRDMTEHHAVQV